MSNLKNNLSNNNEKPSFNFSKARTSFRTSLLLKKSQQSDHEQITIGKWFRDLRASRSHNHQPEMCEPVSRSNPVYHSEGKGMRKRNKDKRRLSFNDSSNKSCVDGKEKQVLMNNSSPPNNIFTYIQQQTNTEKIASRSESTNSLPSSSGLSSWGSTQDASKTGWDQAPTPPIRDYSSLRYGNTGHEKFPSWPVPVTNDTTNPTMRACCQTARGSHSASRSWSERSKSKYSPTSPLSLKSVLENCDSALYFLTNDPSSDHQFDSSYARSEGYYSLVSSSDSGITPLIDRLTQYNNYVEDEMFYKKKSDAPVSDRVVSEKMHHRQQIVHSEKVKGPERHVSESVLYLGCTPESFIRTNYKRSPPPKPSLSVAERVMYIEKKELDVKFHQPLYKKQWKSDTHLMPPPPPPRPSDRCIRIETNKVTEDRRHPQMGMKVKTFFTDKRSSLSSGSTSSRDTSPRRSETSSDLLGPLIVGPSILIDSWVPERPPKKPFVRALQKQQQKIPANRDIFGKLPPPPPPMEQTVSKIVVDKNMYLITSDKTKNRVPADKAQPQVPLEKHIHSHNTIENNLIYPITSDRKLSIEKPYMPEILQGQKSPTKLMQPLSHETQQGKISPVKQEYQITPEKLQGKISPIKQVSPTTTDKSQGNVSPEKDTRLLVPESADNLITENRPGQISPLKLTYQASEEKQQGQISPVRLHRQVSEEKLPGQTSPIRLQRQISEEKQQGQISPVRLHRQVSNEKLPGQTSPIRLQHQISEERQQGQKSSVKLNHQISVERQHGQKSPVKLNHQISVERQHGQKSPVKLNHQISEERQQGQISPVKLNHQISEERQQGQISPVKLYRQTSYDKINCEENNVNQMPAEKPLLQIQGEHSGEKRSNNGSVFKKSYSGDFLVGSYKIKNIGDDDPVCTNNIDETTNKAVIEKVTADANTQTMPSLITTSTVTTTEVVEQKQRTQNAEQEYNEFSKRLLEKLSPEDKVHQILTKPIEDKSVFSKISETVISTPEITMSSKATETTIEEQENSNEKQENLQELKRELVDRLEGKIKLLKNELVFLIEEQNANDKIGVTLGEKLRERSCTHEEKKFASYTDEIDKVTYLMLVINTRLAKVDSALNGLTEDTVERKTLLTRKEAINQQFEEARMLKENIDKRCTTFCSLLDNCLGPAFTEDFKHFIKCKASLMIEIREIQDKVKLGEEQLKALQQTF